MDKEPSATELEKINQQYTDLTEKIRDVDHKLALRKSIQSYMITLGLILFFSSLALFGVIILMILTGSFHNYSSLLLTLVLILVIIWIVFFVVSRINIKNISKNSILRNKLAKQLNEIEPRITKVKSLLDKKKQKQKKLENEERVLETQGLSMELSKTENGNHKFVTRTGELKWGSEKEITEWNKEEKKLIFEEEQKKKGLVKFVPANLQIRELMMEEGHTEVFNSKISRKWKKSKDIPSEITWASPEQVFEWTQKEKGYIKFIDDDGKTRWETKKQNAKMQKEKSQKTRE